MTDEIAMQKARALWALLDDIDTMDDACRSNDSAFRHAVRRIQCRRFEIMSGAEFDALAAQGIKLEGEG